MTIALEQLADGSISDRNFQTLMSLVLDTGGVSAGIRFGTTTLTWAAAGLNSNAQTVTHGLGKTPIVVGAWGSDAGTAALFGCYPFSFTATQFSLRGFANVAPGVQTVSATWVVIG